MVKEISKWWWIGSHNTTDASPWLHSTLSELDGKTSAMLRVIEEDADSFAERAEMYYKKRPELVTMVEDLYRTYRSLAERYDLARSSSLHKHAPPEKSDCKNEFLVEKIHEKTADMVEPWVIHAPGTPEISSYKNEYWSDTSEPEEYPESEVYDDESMVDDNDDDEASAMMMKDEIERLREENKSFKEVLRQKDEEKREAIRQLSLAVDYLKEENLELKKRVSAAAKQKEMSPQTQLWSHFELMKLREGIFDRTWF